MPSHAPPCRSNNLLKIPRSRAGSSAVLPENLIRPPAIDFIFFGFGPWKQNFVAPSGPPGPRWRGSIPLQQATTICGRGGRPRPIFERVSLREFTRLPPGNAFGFGALVFDSGFAIGLSTKQPCPLTLSGGEPDGPGPSSRRARRCGSRRCATGSPSFPYSGLLWSR